jgi:hypothetical protein
VSGACGPFGGEERCAQGSSGETRGKEASEETQTQMDLQEVGVVETGWS